MEAADALVPAAASTDGAQGADAPKMLFQPGGIVFEVLAVSAFLRGRVLFTERNPSEDFRKEK